jgi:hypothetical protein
MSAIGNMVDTIMRDTGGLRKEPVSREDYLRWKQEYLFDALRGIEYGRSFCDRFNVLDFRIFYSKHLDTCDYYIQEHWVEKS